MAGKIKENGGEIKENDRENQGGGYGTSRGMIEIIKEDGRENQEEWWGKSRGMVG